MNKNNSFIIQNWVIIVSKIFICYLMTLYFSISELETTQPYRQGACPMAGTSAFTPYSITLGNYFNSVIVIFIVNRVIVNIWIWQIGLVINWLRLLVELVKGWVANSTKYLFSLADTSHRSWYRYVAKSEWNNNILTSALLFALRNT